MVTGRHRCGLSEFKRKAIKGHGMHSIPFSDSSDLIEVYNVLDNILLWLIELEDEKMEMRNEKKN